MAISHVFFTSLKSKLPSLTNNTYLYVYTLKKIYNTEASQSHWLIDLYAYRSLIAASVMLLLIFLMFSKSSNRPTGDWSTDGCTTSVSRNIVTCSCNHLTHFAILLSPGIEVCPSVILIIDFTAS